MNSLNFSRFFTSLAVACAALMLLPAHAWAQSKTTFGSTNASACYRESNLPLTDYGLRFCNRALDEKDLVLRDRAATHTNRGIIYAAHGQLDKAMADHNRAAKLAPGMAKIYVNRGNVHHQQHNYTQALDDYKLALELGGVAPEIVYYNRALTLIRIKRWDQARISLEKGLEANPDSERIKKKLAQFDLPVEQPQAPAVEKAGRL